MDQEVRLTPREVEVGKLAGQGLTDKKIAEILFISYGTVRSHIHSTLGKTGCPNRTALGNWIRENDPTGEKRTGPHRWDSKEKAKDRD